MVLAPRDEHGNESAEAVRRPPKERATVTVAGAMYIHWGTSGGDQAGRSAGRGQCRADRIEDASASFVERSMEGGAGGQAMAAAAETLGQAGNVDGSAAEAHLHTAARLLHEEQADFDAGHTAGKVYQVFGILRSGIRQFVVAAEYLAVRQPAIFRHLQP